MSEIKLNVNPVGQDLVDQVRDLVPVRTGRLKNSIQYKVNTLGVVKQEDLSSRSRGIMARVDIVEALSTLDPKVLEEQIKEIIKYD